jgi:hypothetical protein
MGTSSIQIPGTKQTLSDQFLVGFQSWNVASPRLLEKAFTYNLIIYINL